VYKNASATPLADTNYSKSAATSTSVTFTFTDNTANSYTFTVTATAGASTLTSATSAAVNTPAPISLLLVSVSQYNYYISSNGTSWTSGSLPAGLVNNNIGVNTYQMAYNKSNQTYYVGCNNVSNPPTLPAIAYSTDGINWTKISITGSSGNPCAVGAIMYAKNMLVSMVGAANYANFIYSTNGTTWQNGTVLTNGANAWGFGYSTTKDIFVASVNDGGPFWWSKDGMNWTKTTYGQNGGGIGTIAVNDTGANGPVFIAGGAAYYYSSNDGKIWTQNTSPLGASTKIFCCYFSPTLSLWAMVGGDNASNPYTATSSDGVNWTTKTTNLSFQNGGISLQYIPSISLWICYSQAAGGILTSPDLTTWTKRNNQTGGNNCIGSNLSDNASYS